MTNLRDNSRRLSWRATVSVSAIAMSLAWASPALAQAEAASLEGHVSGAPAGTAVTVTDLVTGRTVTTTLDANGNYVVLGLRPSTYSVAVAGKAAQQTTLLVGQTGVVDFETTTTTDANGREVVVVGRTLREVRTPSVSTNVTPEQIENLPQNKRNFLSFAALAPGVYVAPGQNTQVQSGAISASNVNVLLDGMTLKNPINHGGVFGQNFGLGNPFPQIAIQEYKVETQNFGAETGQAGSALITAVTKTGGNVPHGSAFIQFQPNSFITQPYFDKKNGVPKPAYNRKQFGGDFSGPIIPDKLSFYVAAEGTSQSLPAATGLVTVPIPTAIEAQIETPRNFDFNQKLFFGKMTWFGTPDDTVTLSGFLRRENNLSDIDINATPSHGRTISTRQKRYQLGWQHSRGDFLNALNIAYDKGTQATPSVGTGPEYVISNSAAQDFSTAALLGAHFFEQGDRQETWTIKDDMTWRKGIHTLKAGGHIAFMDLARTVNNRFNGTYYFTNPGPAGGIDFTRPYGAQINIQPTPTLAAKNTQLGLYVQDTYKPDEHWTINAGLRWDLETNANNNNYVTPTAIANALRAYPGWQARGIRADDYISTGDNRRPQYDAFQPRLGVAYDVRGDRDTVIFGGAGRYYDRSLFIEGVIETLTNSNNIVTVNFNGACQAAVRPAYCTDPDALRASLQGTGAGGSVFVLNNKTRLPYSDQFDIGVRKRFGGIQTSVTFSHVRSHNIFQFVRANFYTNGWYTRFLIRDGAGNVIGCTDGGDAWIQDFTPNSTFPACPAGGGQLAGFSGKLNRGAADGKATLNALFLQAEKPFTKNAPWGFTTAVTLNRARSNDAMELFNDEFFNGARQDAYGTNGVNGVEKWRWVSSVNYRAPWDIILSGNLTMSSGPAFGNIQAPWNSPITVPDGACCYANFGGVFYPKPAIGYKRLDARIAKSFRLGGGHELTADFQVFNAFNWLNRNYSSWGAGAGNPAPRTEDSQVGADARAFQAGIKYSF